VNDVNRKVVKVYGAGGFRGVNAYGSGVLISAEGHILTVASPLLDTQDLRVFLWDGRRISAKLLVSEPALDVALLQLKPEGKVQFEPLPHFDFATATQAPLATPGTWVLGFSNLFEIATRDEPVSVQRGVLAAHARLQGRRGVFEAPFAGDVYFIDAITNNPGAGGGALVNRKGELLGIIGKELRNTLSDTWINYAVPVQAKVDVNDGEKSKTVSMSEFVNLGIKGQYKPAPKVERREGLGGFSGLVLVPNVVDRTPPFIELVLPNSPAARAGLKADDLIVYFDGEPVVSVKAFKELLGRTRPGAKIKLEVRRGEKLITAELTLEDLPKKPKK
jgi:serine protease Do